MKALLAPPSLFSAYAYAEDGRDPYLRWGTHVRIFAGLGASFPLTPFAIFRFKSGIREQPHYLITDRAGNRQERLDLSETGLIDVTFLPSTGNRFHIVRVTITDEEGGVEGAQLLDQHDHVIAERHTPPWQFSAPLLYKLRIWGNSTELKLDVISTDIDTLLAENLEAVTVLGLPVAGLHQWYSGLDDRQTGLQRVERGAPLLLNAMDRPDGPFDPIGGEAEVARVTALLGTADSFGGGIDNLLQNLVEGEEDELPPWQQVETQIASGENGKIYHTKVQRLGSLQTAALDPGVARYLGFADLIEEYPDSEDPESWDTLAVVGLFAIDPDDFVPHGIDLSSLNHAPDPVADRLLGRLQEALAQHAHSEHINAEVAQVREAAQERGWLVTPLITLIAPVPPWLPPTLPTPIIRDHHWQAAKDSLVSSLYRATFAFPGKKLVTLCAQGALLDGTWQTRHDLLESGPFEPPQRATPVFMGQQARYRRFKSAGQLADHDLPAAAGSIAYRVRAADLFGRFGEPTEFAIAPPARPTPPPPNLQFIVEPAEIDLTFRGKLSPGALRVTAAVGRPGMEPFTLEEQNLLGTAIVVPRIEDLAAGTLPLTQLVLLVDGVPIEPPIDLTASGFFDVVYPLEELEPTEQKTWSLSAYFINEAFKYSELVTLPVTVTDRRPPETYKTGVGLLWTSKPGPASNVELTLAWQGKAHSLHRVYLTDQQGLGLSNAMLEAAAGAAAQLDAPPARGLIAAVGCEAVRNGQAGIDKRVYRLLTDPPIQADDQGHVFYQTTLPRTLATVQFLRVVPLGPDGGEPPFEQCGIVPIAVPESRHPTAPRLEGEVDAATGIAYLRVSTDGIDLQTLQRDEPGLFIRGEKGTNLPQFRIRRAAGAVADPIYARSVGKLLKTKFNEAEGCFIGHFKDSNGKNGLVPFVPYVYWAEVQLPAERRLPAGWRPIASNIKSVYPAHAQSHPRPPSHPSPPLTLMYVPIDPPAALQPETVIIVRGQLDATGSVPLTISLPVPPQHPKQIGPYRLAVWARWPEHNFEPVGLAVGGAWPALSTGAIDMAVALLGSVDEREPLTLRLALVDPVGRLGPLLSIEVSEPLPPEPMLGPITFTQLPWPLQRLLVQWEIVSPPQPNPLGNYTLAVTLDNEQMAEPQTVQATLDMIPTVSLQALRAVTLGQIMRVPDTHRYFVLLHDVRPLDVAVTLYDPQGRSSMEMATFH